jgi:hypothetical protein
MEHAGRQLRRDLTHHATRARLGEAIGNGLARRQLLVNQQQ